MGRVYMWPYVCMYIMVYDYSTLDDLRQLIVTGIPEFGQLDVFELGRTDVGMVPFLSTHLVRVRPPVQGGRRLWQVDGGVFFYVRPGHVTGCVWWRRWWFLHLKTNKKKKKTKQTKIENEIFSPSRRVYLLLRFITVSFASGRPKLTGRIGFRRAFARVTWTRFCCILVFGRSSLNGDNNRNAYCPVYNVRITIISIENVLITRNPQRFYAPVAILFERKLWKKI